jgi:DnaJ-domain-containing protein 1
LHGEVLVDDFLVPPSVIGAAVRGQITARLLLIDQLHDARVHFRVAVRAPRGALREPLSPRDFLAGRRRARDAAPHAHQAPRPRETAPRDDASAWRVLGVAPGSDATEIKRAFRRRARELHPDLHPHATDEQRRTLEARFAEVTAAYRTLVA